MTMLKNAVPMFDQGASGAEREIHDQQVSASAFAYDALKAAGVDMREYIRDDDVLATSAA
jgi:hypothetical protein